MQLAFNPAQYDFYSGAALLAAGDYPATAIEDIAERTKDGSGGLLKVTFQVMQSHPNQGHKLFNRFNLWNASPASVEIAHKQYKTFLAATGITDAIQDTQQSFNRPLILVVTNDGTYNNIVGFKTINGTVPGKEGTAGPLTPQQPQQPQFGAPPAQLLQFPQPGAPPQFGQPPAFAAPAPQQQPAQPNWGAPAPQQQPAQPNWGAPAPSQQPQGFSTPQFQAPPAQGGFQPPQQSQPQFQQQPNPATGFQQQPPQGVPAGWPQQ